MTQASQSVMARIMALLAQAESTDYEEEAATFLGKAQELMIKYAIDQSDLKPADRERMTIERIPFGSNKPDEYLLSWVAQAADCRTVTHSKHGDRWSRGGVIAMSIVGLPTDIAYVQALYASLILQREAALRRARRDYWESGRTFNHSFRLGYAERVFQRLERAKRHTVQDSAPGTALVLADKGKQAERYMREQFAGLRAGRSSTSAGSSLGREAGQRAGDRADISGGRGSVGGSRPALG